MEEIYEALLWHVDLGARFIFHYTSLDGKLMYF